MCDLLAILGKDSWGEIGCVAAPRVLLFTPVLLLIVHRLTDTSGHMNDLTSDADPLQLCDYVLSVSKLTCRASSEPSTLE